VLIECSPESQVKKHGKKSADELSHANAGWLKTSAASGCYKRFRPTVGMAGRAWVAMLARLSAATLPG
jgi:hypothetical protein